MNPRLRESVRPYFLLLPAIGLFSVFIGLPALLAIGIAFKRIDLSAGFLDSAWVGLQNFRDLFANVLLAERIGRAFRNTILFTVCFVPVNLFLSLTLASIIHSLGQRRQTFYRAAFYLPAVTSAIVFAMIWKWLYDSNFGLLNYLLSLADLGPVNWTGDPDWAIWSVIIAAIGVGPGGNILIYLATLGSVPSSSVESAKVEGANGLQTWWYVTLPHLRPTTLYLLVLNTIGSFQVFELVFMLTSGGPAGSSTVLVYEIYDLAFKQGRYGPAGALSLILLVIVAALAFLQFRVLGRREDRVRPSRIGQLVGALHDGVGRFLGALGGLAERVARFPGSLRPFRKGPLPSARRHPLLKTLRREAPAHVLLFPLAALFLAPLVWMFLSAFTPGIYLQSSPPQVALSHLSLSNYARLAEAAPAIARWFWNSTYLSLLVTTVQTLLSCLTGYVFARLAFRGRGALFSILIASIMLPYQSLVIPLFLVISSGIRGVLHLDLLNTHWAVILPALFSPVGVFLMRQYIEGLPRDLEEAARMDGCGDFGVWYRVVLPLCRPVVGAWGILTFTAVWRSFFWPFVVLGSESLFTLEVGLQTLQQQNVKDFGLVMAGATVSAVPMMLVFLVFEKHIVRGLTLGALKG